MKEKKCNCKEMSCKEDCSQRHTHKGIFCEVCEPEACAQMYSKDPRKERLDHVMNQIVDNAKLTSMLPLTKEGDNEWTARKEAGEVPFGWREDFDKEFPNSRGIFENGDPYNSRRNAIKAFIEKVSKEERQRVIEEIEKYIEVNDMKFETLNRESGQFENPKPLSSRIVINRKGLLSKLSELKDHE